MAIQQSSLSRAPRPSSLADVLDLILDKGLVVDAYVRFAVLALEAVTIDARIVMASIDTYLRFAEAVNRMDLTETETPGLKELQQGSGDGKNSKSKGMWEGAKEVFRIDREEQDDGKRSRNREG